VFARILAEGQRDGSFDIDDPDETARLLLHMGAYLGDTFGEAYRKQGVDLAATTEHMKRACAAYERGLEKLLGLPKHTISLGDIESMELFLKPEGP
jgi:hypothetical protein